MSPYGHLTRKTCEGRGLELIQALDAGIHYKTGYYHESVRKFARAERDPLTSTILDACREYGMQLVASRNTDGAGDIPMTHDEDVRRYCLTLRRHLLEEHRRDYAQILYDIDLSTTKLAQWTREQCSSPRFGELVRLAYRLGYRIWFFDLSSNTKIQ